MTETKVAEVMTELAALEDPEMREVNERHGDDQDARRPRPRGLLDVIEAQMRDAPIWITEMVRRTDASSGARAR